LEETKEVLKMQKVTVGHFVVRKLENPHILRILRFFSGQTRKKKGADYASKYGIVVLMCHSISFPNSRILH
jgi:hypothetical protein